MERGGRRCLSAKNMSSATYYVNMGITAAGKIAALYINLGPICPTIRKPTTTNERRKCHDNLCAL